MSTIATGIQTRWRDCYAPSERVRLTLRTNGEEKTQIITPQGALVLAGFDAPTAVATMITATTGGNIPRNMYYYYVYVYASTQYPFVQNDQTISGGELWPRSNPSPISASIKTGAGTDTNTVTVTATKTSRSDVDKIVFYKTVGSLDAAEALTRAQAGQYWYAGTVDNNGISGTTQFVDTVDTVEDELIELDNYVADTAWFCVFDGIYWWAAGNPRYESDVTLTGANTVAMDASAPALFDGRNGQVATFEGITSGGYDGQGNFYVKVDSATTISLYLDKDLTVPASFPFTGTSHLVIKGFSSVLYRSKPYNPFSWGLTETIINQDGSQITEPQSFALEMGGGFVCALALVNNGKILKVDFENPQRTITYDLNFADQDTFGLTQKIIDNTGSVTCHFSQFQGIYQGQSVLLGLDTYNGNILACNGSSQQIISTDLGGFLSQLDCSDDRHRFFHGGFDPGTEMNCFWVRYFDTECTINVLIWNHSETNYWSWTPDFNVQSSFMCLDIDTSGRFLIGGTDEGHIGRLFDSTYYDNLINGIGWRQSSCTTQSVNPDYEFSFETTDTYQLVEANSGGSTLTTTGAPSCAVGDSILILLDTGAYVDANVVSIDGNEVAFDTTVTSAFGIWVNLTRLNGIWCVFSNAAKTNHWWVRISAVVNDIQIVIGQPTVATLQANGTLLEYFEFGTTEVLTWTPGGVPPWGGNPFLYCGVIPASLRMYFDLDKPTVNKRSTEFWITAENVNDHGDAGGYQLTGRQYLDFQDTTTALRSFDLNRDTLPDGSASNVWFTHNGVPSTELKQMGFELREIGFDPLVVYNITITTNATS